MKFDKRQKLNILFSVECESHKPYFVLYLLKFDVNLCAFALFTETNKTEQYFNELRKFISNTYSMGLHFVFECQTIPSQYLYKITKCWTFCIVSFLISTFNIHLFFRFRFTFFACSAFSKNKQYPLCSNMKRLASMNFCGKCSSMDCIWSTNKSACINERISISFAWECVSTRI